MLLRDAGTGLRFLSNQDVFVKLAGNLDMFHNSNNKNL